MTLDKIIDLKTEFLYKGAPAKVIATKYYVDLVRAACKDSDGDHPALYSRTLVLHFESEGIETVLVSQFPKPAFLDLKDYDLQSANQ